MTSTNAPSHSQPHPPSMTPRSPRKMRATRQRPNSQHGPHVAAPPFLVQQQGRKIFNCIVDDSALVAGVKRSTRNGIRQWVKNGQIRLFVPLHALEQLSCLKNVGNRYSDDVRETLHWLDDATSKFPNVVTLQGADEIYETWSQVEKFSVPRTLFSENDEEIEPDSNDPIEPDVSILTLDDTIRKTPASSVASDASRSLSPSSMRSQLSSLSAMSPPTSPIKAVPSPEQPAALVLEESTAASAASVPLRLQPLFNYIIWRVHQELDPVAALESFIFLCNDQSKVHYTKGFDIKTKRLEQLRDAIGREDRDFKNRQMVAGREHQTPAATSMTTSVDVSDDVLLRPPPKAPAAMLSKQATQNRTQSNVMDPDAFGRNTPVTLVQDAPLSPRAPPVAPQALRDGGSLPYAPRGTHHHRGNFRGGTRGRGNFAGPGRAGFAPNARRDGMIPNGQIDPNSFVRPREAGYTGRGGRRLWTPT